MVKFPVSYFLRGRSLYTKVSAGLLLLFSIVFFFITREFISSIYSDNDISKFISFEMLVLVSYFPIILGATTLIILLKVIIDRLSVFGSSKNHIRFNLVITFLGIVIVSFFVYIGIFQYVFNRTLDFVDDKTSISMKKMLKDHRKEIESSLSLMKNELEAKKKLIINGAISLDKTGFDNVLVYDLDDRSLRAIKQSIVSSNVLFLIQELNPIRESFQEKKGFTRFILEKRAYVVGSFISRHELLVAIRYDKSDLSERVSDIVHILQSSNNFQVLKPIMIKLFILSFLYFYLPIFLLGLIFYFFISYQVLVPINAISEFSREFAERYLGARIKAQDGNEVTQLVESYKKMMRSFSKKRRQDKMLAEYEAWKGIAVRMAHEIKNPLTPIQLAVDDIEERLRHEDPDLYLETYSQFGTVENKIEFIRKLIKEFSDFSRNIEIELEVKTLSEIRDELKKEIESFQNLGDIELLFLDGLKKGDLAIEVHVNLEKLHQVLGNLISNSIDSLNSVERKKKLIEVHFFARDGRMLIWVVDNGVGIQRQDQSKIFEPYFTKKATGTGLGLAICREIIIHHRGMIWATTEEGKTFIKMSIPLSSKKNLTKKGKF